MKNKAPFALIVLDGLAHNPNERGNAVKAARKPNLDKIFSTCPYTELVTHGVRVGLPGEQMGNSEVGHLNLGAGRVVKQDLLRIDEAVRDKKLRTFAALKKCTMQGNKDQNALHILGLCSPGGVHSSIEHLYGILAEALSAGAKRVYIHAISDGRDRPQTASLEELLPLELRVKELRKEYPEAQIAIADLCGRYYAMDRDKRWERTKLAYDLYTKGVGEKYTDLKTAIETRIKLGETDEFYKPSVLELPGGYRSAEIRSGDALVCFNFRADRMRQIVSAFLGKKVGFTGFEITEELALQELVTLTEYSADLPVDILFPQVKIANHLGEVISNSGLKQFRLAETEKYPHVTYFFNGGEEVPFPGEVRSVVPSPRDVATYDLKPEMSAEAVTDILVTQLREKSSDLYIVNYANCDMVGHTGVFDAAVKAVETVDTCMGRFLKELENQGGSALITADHGNADQMIDYDTGEPHTFHTKYPVPLVLVGPLGIGKMLRSGGTLSDIAPTILELINIKQPAEMTGISLIKK